MQIIKPLIIFFCCIQQSRMIVMLPKLEAVITLILFSCLFKNMQPLFAVAGLRDEGGGIGVWIASSGEPATERFVKYFGAYQCVVKGAFAFKKVRR